MKDKINYKSMLETHKKTKKIVVDILNNCETGNIKIPIVSIFPHEGPPSPWVQLYASDTIYILKLIILHLNLQIQICKNNIKSNKILN